MKQREQTEAQRQVEGTFGEAEGRTATSTHALFFQIVARIRAGDPNATVDFTTSYRRGARILFRRYLGAIGVDRIVDEAMTGAIEEIRRGWISEPRELVHFFRAVIERQDGQARSGTNRQLIPRDSEAQGVTEKAHVREKAAVLESALRHFTQMERGALEKYYLKGEPLAQVLDDAGMTIEDFERLKERLYRVANRTKSRLDFTITPKARAADSTA